MKCKISFKKQNKSSKYNCWCLWECWFNWVMGMLLVVLKCKWDLWIKLSNLDNFWANINFYFVGSIFMLIWRRPYVTMGSTRHQWSLCWWFLVCIPSYSHKILFLCLIVHSKPIMFKKKMLMDFKMWKGALSTSSNYI